MHQTSGCRIVDRMETGYPSNRNDPGNYEEFGNKKADNPFELSALVAGEGLEPSTFGL